MNYNYKQVSNANQYLMRFDEILCQMADKMLSSKITNSITLDFIQNMIPHHQAAIYMSENLLKYTNYPPLQNIARDIIKMQTNGIEQMQEIARTTRGYINSQINVNNYYTKYLSITKNMINEMKNSLRTPNINLDFVTEMIPHHKGAIAMCENLLQYCIDPRLKCVANTIIKEQSEGVRELENIRKFF